MGNTSLKICELLLDTPELHQCPHPEGGVACHALGFLATALISPLVSPP